MTITIRPETTADLPAIYAINQQAFEGRTAEPGLVNAIREGEGFIPELSMVAEVDGRPVGHILFSPISITTQGGEIPALALAPMAVLPAFQNGGIGSELVRAGLEAARQMGHAIVIVLGHPNFYPRFGFSASLARALECPYGDCGEAWMAQELVEGALAGVRGRVVYPAAFDGV